MFSQIFFTENQETTLFRFPSPMISLRISLTPTDFHQQTNDEDQSPVYSQPFILNKAHSEILYLSHCPQQGYSSSLPSIVILPKEDHENPLNPIVKLSKVNTLEFIGEIEFHHIPNPIELGTWKILQMYTPTLFLSQKPSKISRKTN